MVEWCLSEQQREEHLLGEVYKVPEQHELEIVLRPNIFAEGMYMMQDYYGARPNQIQKCGWQHI